MIRPSPDSLHFRLELLTVFLLGLLVRVALIHFQPAIYGGDPLVRIMNADRVVLAYQLPLLQLLIYLVNLISRDPQWIRHLMGALGAMAGAAFYLLSATLLDRSVARLATLFFVFNPFLLVHSIVPYQEILMLLLLCLGLSCLLPPARRTTSSSNTSAGSVARWTGGDFRGVAEDVETDANLPLTSSLCKEGDRCIAWASLFLGLACLTRYEAWVIAAVAGLYHLRTRFAGRYTLNTLWLLVRTIILFGWAPLFWILAHHGVSPQGTYVLEEPATWARVWRIPYIIAMSMYHVGPIVGCLALLGLLVFWKQSLWKKLGIQMVLAAAALLLLSLVFSAHGVEPDPQRYVTDREAHWFVLFPFWAAALGLISLQRRLSPQAESPNSQQANASRKRHLSICSLSLGLAVVWGVVQTNRYIERLLADQNLSLDYAVAQHLKRNLPHGSKALVFAKPLPPEATQEYFTKVYLQGGSRALDVARQQLAELKSGPLDYCRVVVNSHLGIDRILDGSKAIVQASDAEEFLSQNQVRLAVIFSNYPTQQINGPGLLEHIMRRGRTLVTLRDRGLTASIVEVSL